MSKNKSIVHLDLDTFFVSCERLLDSSLNNKPVLIGGTSDRGVVASCSYEARKFGVHSAMPMKTARRLCPEAVVIRGESSIYSKYSKLVTQVVEDSSPLFEKSSIDEFYIDVTGMDQFFGCYKWAKELRNRIKTETGLPLSFGLSSSKTVSKVSTGLAKPDNHKKVDYGTEMPFLAPLSTKKIPMVGTKTYTKLRSMGLKRIGTIQQMPLEMMDRALGKHGSVIWKKARGIDNSPVEPYFERKSISIERTFEKDTTDIRKLRSLITAMAENLAFQLRNGDKLTSCATLKIRYADFQTVSKQKKIPYSACDQQLIKVVLDLFESLYSRRVSIRLVGVRFSGLVGGGHQMRLFEQSTETIQLYQAMDHIRKRFGQDAVKRAVGIGSKKHWADQPIQWAATGYSCT